MTRPNVNVVVGGHQEPSDAYKKVVLKNNLPFASQVTESNCIYVIRWSFDLDGGTVTIPENCVLQFDGGKITNGTIVGQNTYLFYTTPLDAVITAERQGTFIYNTTIADEEDITSESGILKFKDRPTTNGMGMIILRNDKTLAEQITQANTIYKIQYDFSLGNVDSKTLIFTNSQLSTIATPEYIAKINADAAYAEDPTEGNLAKKNAAQADYEAIGSLQYYAWQQVELESGHALHITGRAIRLNNSRNDTIETDNGIIYAETDITVYIGCIIGNFTYRYDKYVVIPNNCVLEFEGGSLSNGTINGKNTSINVNIQYKIFNNVIPVNFDFPYLNPKWFGAKADYNEETKTGTDDYLSFQKCLELIDACYCGIAIYIQGKFYIGTNIETRGDFNIIGNHHFSRELLSLTPRTSDYTSPSLLAIGACTAFTLKGRGYNESTADPTNYLNISVRGVKVIGITEERINCKFIYCTASHSPSRNGIIEECEFTNLGAVVEFYGKNTMMCPFVFSKCHAYKNTSVIKATLNSSLSGSAITLSSVVIKDSTIEHNSSECIHIEGLFGNCTIENCLIEGEPNPIYIDGINRSAVEIKGNYFEQVQRIIYTNNIHSFYMYNNFIGTSSDYIELRSTTIMTLDAQDMYNSNNILKSCKINCVPLGFKLSWIKSVCYFSYFKYSNKQHNSYAGYFNDLINNTPARKITASTPMYEGQFITGNTYYFAYYADTENYINVEGVDDAQMTAYSNSKYITIVPIDGKDEEGSAINHKFYFVLSATSAGYKVASFEKLTEDSDLMSLTIDDINAPMVNKTSNINFTPPTGFLMYDTELNKGICWDGTAWINLDGTSLT